MKKFLILFLLIGGILLSGCGETKYTVEFDLNYEGAPAGPAAQELAKGDKATEPLAPTRAGYEFLGWFKNEDDEEPYDFSLEVEASFVLYAKWREVEADVVWYLGGSFNNYAPDDPDYVMEKGEDGIYTFTVELTDDNRDKTYDGHYYKVTDGTWEVCYGVDNYYINPAPASPTGGGLGSIWHWANGTLTVRFDPEELLITDELVMKEDIIEELDPRLYGKFNGWAIDGETAIVMSDPDGDGIYTAEIEFEEGDTSDFTVCVSRKWYDDQWGQRWGAHEQYKLDGAPAGMGDASEITYEAGKYLFAYDSATKTTEYVKLEDGVVHEYASPRLYGKFNGWAIDGEAAVALTDPDGDGVYEAIVEFEEGDTSDFTVCLSRKWYDDEWGQRWGAHEQYKFDGAAAGMGDVTEITYEAGKYLFTYNSATKESSYGKLEDGFVDAYALPRLYGKFNGWAIDGENAFVFLETEEEGIYTLTVTFDEGDTSDFTVCVSRKWYDDEWGERWGAGEQYKFDGAAAGMGDATEITYEAGTYLFTYNAATKVTTYEKK